MATFSYIILQLEAKSVIFPKLIKVVQVIVIAVCRRTCRLTY